MHLVSSSCKSSLPEAGQEISRAGRAGNEEASASWAADSRCHTGRLTPDVVNAVLEAGWLSKC